jgi:ferredoxin
MESACGGFAACNSCRVVVLDGELTPLLPEEEPFLDGPDQRLGCQARVAGGDRVAVRLAPG